MGGGGFEGPCCLTAVLTVEHAKLQPIKGQHRPPLWRVAAVLWKQQH